MLQKIERERNINFELGVDAPPDYVPPPQSVRAPKWLRTLRGKAVCYSRLVPSTEAESHYIAFIARRVDNPKAPSVTEDVEKMWQLVSDSDDVNLAAKLMNAAASAGAQLTPGVFTAAVDACLRTDELEVARYLLDNHKLMGFYAIEFADILRVREVTQDMECQLEEEAPENVKAYQEALDAHIATLLTPTEDKKIAVEE